MWNSHPREDDPRTWQEAVMRDDGDAGRWAVRLQTAAAIGLALGIFALDVVSPLQGAVAVLYTTVVLVVARDDDRKQIVGAGLACALLAIAGYVVSHWAEPLGSPAMRLAVSLVAIAVTIFLCLRHHAANELRRQSEERYRTIFDSAGFAIWEADWSAAYSLLRPGQAVDRDVDHVVRMAIIRDANQASAMLFGVNDKQDLIGGSFVAYYTPAAVATLGRIVKGLLGGESTIEEETQIQSSSGEIVDVVLRVTLPPDNAGWKRVLVIALDVTERKRAQSRLAQSQTALAHVSRVTMLGELAASLAHEVSQPLAAIITYANSGTRWLARESPEAGEVADCLNHIAANGARAADVIARTRDLARNADPRQALFEVAPLIDETIMLLRGDLQKHKIAVSPSVAPDLPRVLGDRVQIQQVLMNLMLNAQQAMMDVSPARREVGLDAAADGDALVIQVRDCGTGISVDPDSLFSPFFTTKPEGMGMGLSICRSIIERHGGVLTAANNPERGATFQFRLPVATEASPARQIEADNSLRRPVAMSAMGRLC